MAGSGRYLISITNDQAGASNPAIATVWVNPPAIITQPEVVAQMVALSQYFLSAVGTRVQGIEYSAAPTGGTLPVGFPVAEYAFLAGGDANLVPMAAYGVSYGVGAITPLGVGAVVSRRTTTPGRSGRGRLTTPWLRASEVTAQGGLGPASASAIRAGHENYLKGDNTNLPGAVGFNLNPYVNSATGDHLITNFTVSLRLGRLRSRTS